MLIRNCSCLAISVKNLLYLLNGYIPNQIVLGRNLNMPSVLKDKLPALQPGEVSSVTVENSLKAMYKLLKHSLNANLQTESSELLIMTLEVAMMYGLILEIVYITSKKIIAYGVD